MIWAELMHKMVDPMVKSLRKVRKAGTPLPSYLVHLYAHCKLLALHEQESYDDVLSVQKYSGPETDSEEEPHSPNAIAPALVDTPPAWSGADWPKGP